jgi:hypothetical protein
LGAEAQGAIFYQESFDALSAASINGQDSWSSGAGDVVQSSVAVSGQAVRLDDSGAFRTGVFDSETNVPVETVAFDFRLEQTIVEFAGTPNVDIQMAVQFRGPIINTESFLIYKGITNGSGDVVQDRLELRGGSTLTSPVPSPDTWYHAELVYDWTNKTVDGVVTLAGTETVFWDPAVINGLLNNGNINLIGLSPDGTPDVQFYVDNLQIGIAPPPPVPEPSGLLSLMGFVLLIRKRRVR